MQTIPYFGEVDIDSLRDYYSITTEIGGVEVDLDINFTQPSTDSLCISLVSRFLLNIEQFDKENRFQIALDLASQGESDDYFEFYLEEFCEDENIDLVDLTQDRNAQKHQLFNKLELKRVGLYPDQGAMGGYFATFDYSIRIDNKLCNQLLVVNTKEDGSLDHLTWES